MSEELQGSYIYKDKKYTYQRTVKFKHPENRTWVEAVEYCDWETLEMYVREKQEFIKLFKKWYPQL